MKKFRFKVHQCNNNSNFISNCNKIISFNNNNYNKITSFNNNNKNLMFKRSCWIKCLLQKVRMILRIIYRNIFLIFIMILFLIVIHSNLHLIEIIWWRFWIIMKSAELQLARFWSIFTMINFWKVNKCSSFLCRIKFKNIIGVFLHRCNNYYNLLFLIKYQFLQISFTLI